MTLMQEIMLLDAHFGKKGGEKKKKPVGLHNTCLYSCKSSVLHFLSFLYTTILLSIFSIAVNFYHPRYIV